MAAFWPGQQDLPGLLEGAPLGLQLLLLAVVNNAGPTQGALDLLGNEHIPLGLLLGCICLNMCPLLSPAPPFSQPPPLSHLWAPGSEVFAAVCTEQLLVT